jgi:hypothetical protein
MGRPRKNVTKDNQEKVVAEKATTTPVKEDVVETAPDLPATETVEEKPVKVTTKPERVKIDDDEEIDVQSFDSNVTYWDKATDETYFWEEVGEVISMPYGVIKNMWRNHKTYFRNFLLKPLDDRVVKELGLVKTYEKYEFLMDGSKYTKSNLDTIVTTINGGTNGFKSAIFNNIKNMIIGGDITDIYVIKQLGNAFDIDFAGLID